MSTERIEFTERETVHFYRRDNTAVYLLYTSCTTVF